MCTLGLPDGSGYVELASVDPGIQPSFNYCYLRHPNDARRVRDGVRLVGHAGVPGEAPPMMSAGAVSSKCTAVCVLTSIETLPA